jgi:hypothetical protein
MTVIQTAVFTQIGHDLNSSSACVQDISIDACDVTLSVYPHRAGLKNMPSHGGNRTYDLWNTRPYLRPTNTITPTQQIYQ